MNPDNNNPIKETGYITEEDIKRYRNTKIVRIEVDEDKLRLILHEFRDVIYGRRSWIHIGAGTAAFLLSLTTADFKEVFSVKGEIWNAIFFILFALYAGWFLFSVFKSVRHAKKNIIDYTIRKIRGEKLR